jgi:hypothetical protein
MCKGRQKKEITRILKWKSFASKPIGRRKNRWEDDVRKDLQTVKISNWRKSVLNRDLWKTCWADQNTHIGVVSIKNNNGYNWPTSNWSQSEFRVTVTKQRRFVYICDIYVWRYGPHNDVSVNDGQQKRRRTDKIIITKHFSERITVVNLLT